MTPKEFKDSQEARYRRDKRAWVKKSHLTRTEKDILLAFLNHWFVHRHKGGVHPGRKKLAKRSGASLRAVNYTLALLRDFKVIEATAHATGNSAGYRGCATEYKVDGTRLIALCQVPADALKNIRKGAKPRISGCKNARFKGAESAPRNNECNVVPFPKQGRA